ncbi:MAG: hypothetical protein ABSB22_03245 [Thermodesulfobacteriota bacterium]
MEPIKIVLRFVNGMVVKGSTRDFSANKDCFHLIPADSSSNGAIEVLLKDLKAVFMVRDFIGTPEYNERKKYVEGEKPSGKKIEVTFTDGEVIVGSTLGYDRNRQGFFIFPADPKSNNIRAFVISSAVKSIRQL